MDKRRYTDGIHPPYPHWNDIERASSVSWDYDCCNPEQSDCVCVTSGDVARWNTVSGISAISGINVSAIDNLIKLDIPTSADKWNDSYNTLSSNSATWNEVSSISGLDVNNIKEKLNTISGELLQLSANGLSAYTEGSIIGKGYKDNPIRLAPSAEEFIDYLTNIIYRDNNSIYDIWPDSVSQDRHSIARGTDIVLLKKDINELNTKYAYHGTRINELDDLVHLLNDFIKNYTDFKNYWVNKKVTLSESTLNPEIFYYWDSTKK